MPNATTARSQRIQANDVIWLTETVDAVYQVVAEADRLC